MRSSPPMRQPSYRVDQYRNDCVLGQYHRERFPDPRTQTGQRYRLDICRDGALTIAKREQKPFNGVAIPALYTTDLQMLQLAQGLVGKLQSDEEPRTRRRIDGVRRYIFSWGIRTGTLSQVERMGDVIWLVMQSRYDEAVDLACKYDEAAASEDPESYGLVYR